MKEIIDIPYGLKEAFNHENEWTALLCAEMAIHLNDGIVIPDNPTNGDMIKAMFPNWKIIEHELAFRIYPYGNDSAYFFLDKKWWNAPYKPQESKVENGNKRVI